MKSCLLIKTALLLQLVTGLLLIGCANPVDPDIDVREVLYQVTVLKTENGTITAVPGQGFEGEEISLWANPQPGYYLQSNSLRFGDLTQGNQAGTNQPIDEKLLPYRFPMPSRNIRVRGAFVPVPSGYYTVTVIPSAHGNIRAIIQSADGVQRGTPGDTVNIIITADPGYGIKEGSLKYNNSQLINGGSFSMPPQHVTITAEFEQKDAAHLLADGKEALESGNYDFAVNLFEAAYQREKGSQEAVIYSTLGKLGTILQSPRVRRELAQIGMSSMPGSINGLMNRTTGNVSGAWLDVYDGIILPKLGSPSGYPNSFHNYLIYNQTYNQDGTCTMDHLTLLLFFNIIGLNAGGNPNRINLLLEDLLIDAFGSDFEEAAKRPASMDYTDRFVIAPSMLQALAPMGLDQWFQDGDPIGRAEIDVILSFVRMVKAGVEWLAAYNWEIDTSFIRVDWWYTTVSMLNPNYSVNKILYDSYGLVPKFLAAKVVDNTLMGKMLPLRNNFLKDRNNGMMARAKNDFALAVDTLKAAIDYYYSPGAQVSAKALTKLNDEYPWLRKSLAELKTAIGTGGNFYIPETLPLTDSWIISESDAKYGINLDKLFAPGQLALNKLVSNETGGTTLKFFGFNDLENGTAITEQSQLSLYENGSFEVNLSPLKAVLVKGLNYNDKVWIHTLFPSMLLDMHNVKPFYEYYYQLSTVPHTKTPNDY
jgi:hypothetical protein